MCRQCMEFEIPNVPSRCYRCQQATKEFATCPNCRRNTSLRHVWVRCLYEGPSSQLLLAFKFERVRAAYLPLAEALTGTMPLIAQDTVVMGVPTVTGRIRERGYDHVRLITRHFATTSKLIWATPVVRSGQVHQFGSSRLVRRKQLENSFHVVQAELIRGKKILLLDDVLTTGATLETLASVLKAAGAKQVDAVVFAQKL